MKKNPPPRARWSPYHVQCLFVYLFTAWKIHMEPTNHPFFSKENDIPNLHDYVPILIFRGVFVYVLPFAVVFFLVGGEGEENWQSGDCQFYLGSLKNSALACCRPWLVLHFCRGVMLHLETCSKTYYWLVVSTHLKNISQNGNLPQFSG